MTASHNAWNNRRNCGEGGEEDGESHRQVRRLHIKGDFPGGLVRWLSAHPKFSDRKERVMRRVPLGPEEPTLTQLAYLGGDGRRSILRRCDAGFHHGLLVEHQVAENARGIDGLREAVVKGFEAMDRRFEAIDRRFDAIDQRFDAIDRRFETIDRRFETIDRRFETSDQRFGAINQTMDRRFEAMDQKLSRQFFWLVGTLVVILLTILTR